jgi:thiol:disulfide interchange protein DsbD
MRSGTRWACWCRFAALGALVIALRAPARRWAGASSCSSRGWSLRVLVYVMIAVGLSLSGVFSIGAGLAGSGQQLTQARRPAGDFFTGVLACVVASPCTAPFMGAALALAFIRVQ